MKRAGADLDIIGLQDDAALLRPIALEREDQPLKAGIRLGGHCVTPGADSRPCRRRARSPRHRRRKLGKRSDPGPQLAIAVAMRSAGGLAAAAAPRDAPLDAAY